MKKYILAPLCSGLVIPGLGQILNNDFKKGLLLLFACFVVFVAGTVKLAFVIKFLVTQSSSAAYDVKALIEIMKAEHLPSLWILAALFSLIWLYSVVDAFRAATKLEKKKGRELT